MRSPSTCPASAHARSPRVWGAAEYAAFVAGVLDEMAAPVVVLGHSFGGKVAVALAVQRPEAVRALVLTGVPLVATKAPVQPARAFALTRRAHRLGLVSDARMEAARQRYGSADYRAAEGVMRQILVKSVGSTTTPSSPASRARSSSSGETTTLPRRRPWPSAPPSCSAPRA